MREIASEVQILPLPQSFAKATELLKLQNMETFHEKNENYLDFKIISRNDLVNRIYKGKSFPQDVRFLDPEKGGSFKYFHLEYIIGIHAHSKEQKMFPLIEVNGMVVALSELEQDPDDHNNFWIKFVSVDPQFRGNGYASKLIQKIFDFAKENNYTLESSFYSEEGLEKLKKVMERVEQETGVKVIRKLQE